MRKIYSFSLVAVAALCFAVAAKAADEAKITCPVSGKEASKEHAAKYKKGKVYFCCDNCPKEFAANTEKYVAKANAQLVETKQYKQKACPLTGKPINKETGVEFAGVKVKFCCGNCQKAVASLDSDDAKIAKVFSDKNFDNGFAVAKKKKAKRAE